MMQSRGSVDMHSWQWRTVGGSLQFSDAALRMYAHPDLLRVAEAFNGPDFSPFNEVIWIKHPRLGGSVAHARGTSAGPGEHRRLSKAVLKMRLLTVRWHRRQKPILGQVAPSRNGAVWIAWWDKQRQ